MTPPPTDLGPSVPSAVARGQRNRYLDVLRAFAVTAVILSHLPPPSPLAPSYVSAAAAFFHRFGGLGVDLFFVLSGFLVSGLLFREQRKTGSARIGRFLVRRGFKIYPAFYVFLIASAALRQYYGDHLRSFDIVSEALFVQNYGGHVWSHTWSLAVEEHFYLLLAGMVAVLQRMRPSDPFRNIPVFFAATTIAVGCVRAAMILLAPFTNETHRFPTHLQIDSLFFGVLLAYGFHLVPRVADVARNHVWTLLAAGALSLGMAQAAGGSAVPYIAGHVLTYCGFGAFVIVAAAAPAQRRPRFVVRSAAAIGEQSYSIYLWHTAVLVFGTIAAVKILGRQPTFYEIAAGYSVAAVLWGIVMAKCVEQPMLALRDRWSDVGFRLRPRPVVAQAFSAANGPLEQR